MASDMSSASAPVGRELSQKEKMLSGQLYFAMGPELVGVSARSLARSRRLTPLRAGERMRAKGVCGSDGRDDSNADAAQLTRRFNNAADPTEEQILAGDATGPERRAIAAELFGLSQPEIERLNPVIEPPIQGPRGEICAVRS